MINRIVILLLFGSWTAFVQGSGMEVDLFVHKDKFGKSLTLDIGEKECTNVPRLWLNLTMSVDTHGSCMQFYDEKNCKGRIAVIQPFHTVHQMDLSLIEFHNAIQSISPCGAKVPSGRFVIQSAVDASILTVQKHGSEFARVYTLPPQAFIPKAQQWEISEKHPNEFDIMPRIHETNYPVTYDGDAMKKGSFIRKIWKIESVGRGRYVIKSEWTQKCLYKTRIRTVEEHDCRAWSPNQEWVLRPLIAPTKPPPTADPQLADGVAFQVPSKVVDKYLNEQKRLREKEKRRRYKQKETHTAAYLEPYRIRSRKQKPSEDSPPQTNPQFRQNVPPNPEVLYSRPAPVFGLRPHPRYRQPGKVVSYVEGISPIYEDAKVDDPTFPDFLLHATSQDDDSDNPLKYKVTRRPFTPEPTGHPDYIPDKKKYDGRVKEQNSPYIQNDEESGEDEEQSAEEEEDEGKGQRDPNEESDEVVTQEDAPQDLEGHKVQPGEEESEEELPQADASKAVEGHKEEESEEDVTQAEASEGGEGQRAPGPEEESEESQEDERGPGGPPSQGDYDGETSQEDQPQYDKQGGEPSNSKKESKEEYEEGDDPAKDVAGFMKLLFQGISNKMKKEEKGKEEMIGIFEK